MLAVSGAKRARITVDEDQPSVHFTYNSLTRFVQVGQKNCSKSQWDILCALREKIELYVLFFLVLKFKVSQSCSLVPLIEILTCA